MTEETPPHLIRLNDEQHDAVTSVTGPLLILAGAGSGKTRVLTRRIAHLLHLGVEPKHILAVTFTNKAAAEMKERVVELVGEVGTKVWMSTFHSTCGRILRYDIEHLGIWTRKFSIYDDDDQIRIIRGIIAELGYDPKEVSPKEILSRIDYYKNRTLSIDDVIRQRRSHLNDRVIRIWREYEAQLQASDAVDFNDLIGLTVRLLGEHPEVLDKWRDRFRYVLVDEYQDTNHSQYTLLRYLTSEHRNLAVVGDDDQSIYGFRGADVSNILNFERDYKGAKIVRLEQNYRSTGNILRVANHVVVQNENRIEKRLWTAGESGVPVNFIDAATQREEAQRVIRAIQMLVRRGKTHEDIAIIYRTNRMSRLFELELNKARIPYRVVGGRKFYERREIRDVLAFLRLVSNPSDDAAFLRIVNVPTRGIGTKTIANLRKEASNRGEPLLRTARAQAAGSSRTARALASFVTLMDSFQLAAREMALPKLIQTVLTETGYLAMLQGDSSRDAEGRLGNLSELMRETLEFHQQSEESEPLDTLQLWLDRIALIGADEQIPDGGMVTLMTVHSSKGLEYPVVFVVHLNEGLFPHARSMDTIDEERRLAYVAFTRAQTHLLIAFARMGTRDDGRTVSHQISRFIQGLPEEACHRPPSDPEPAVADTELASGSRLRRFLQQHQERSAAPSPDLGSYTLIDLEDPSQLVPGTRVLHPSKGVGTVQALVGQGYNARVRVSFQNRPPISLPLMSCSLSLIQE